MLLERRDLNTVRKEKGRLRSYLLTSLKHFLTNEHNRAMAIKRGEGQRLIPLEELHEREAVELGAEGYFDCRANLRARLGVGAPGPGMTRLGDEYRNAGNRRDCLISCRNYSRTNQIALRRQRLHVNWT